MTLSGTHLVKGQTFPRCETRVWPDTGDKKNHAPVQKMDTPHKKLDHYLDESALILETQRGDMQSFNNLVLAYQDSIFNTALRILGDDQLAADATQDAFISAFRNIHRFRGGSFKAWLMRTVTNACYDELRRQKRRPTLPLEPINDEDEEVETPRWLADTGMSPEEKIEAAELERAIFRCLNSLPSDFRLAVVLVDIQGMNYSEAAHIACVPLGTIKSRLARARLRLRDRLQVFRELLPDAFEMEKEVPR